MVNMTEPGLFGSDVVKEKARKWWDEPGNILPRQQQRKLEEAAGDLWDAWDRRFADWQAKVTAGRPPKQPTATQIKLRAQIDAYRAAGCPPVDTETRIDHEGVLVVRKPGKERRDAKR